MVIIFDLDDTLYDERSYVESGLKAVSRFGYSRFDWDPDESFQFMLKILDSLGRGDIFDRWLMSRGKYSKTMVKNCVGVYRHHTPTLTLFDEARTLLPELTENPLYIVTDGHKMVQQAKVQSLGLPEMFKHIYVTHRYGIRHAKPSIYCFEKIKEREDVRWGNMIYIGDNPDKDFVNLTPLGVHTVRVLTGGHRNIKAKPGFDARHTIDDLGNFLELLGDIRTAGG